jgi:hypothetical protein
VDRVTFAERSAALEAFGFTTHQATFLTTVALHSGYCLRRQYTAFAGLKYGNGTRFLDSLVERGFAGRVVFRAERGVIYHLFSHPVYTAIGHENSRNRRHLSPAQLARKLMLLDFVVAHPEYDWYVTRADKLDLLVTRRGVSESVRIPTSPFYLQGTSACVNFVCVVTDPRGSSIESFVRLHASLLRQLNDWTLNALIPECVSTDQVCDGIYRRTLAAASMSSIAPISASQEDMDWFASVRSLVAAGDLRTLGMADLHRYRALSSTLPPRPETRLVNPLVIHQLPHSYTQFGFVPGLT